MARRTIRFSVEAQVKERAKKNRRRFMGEVAGFYRGHRSGPHDKKKVYSRNRCKAETRKLLDDW